MNDMRKLKILGISAVIVVGASLAIGLSVGGMRAGGVSLADKLADLTIEHIERQGLDRESAQFVQGGCYYMWSRRQDLVDLLVPYLTETDPVIVAHALEGLYGIRMYRPLSSLGGFDAENRILFSAMDKAVYGQIDHMHSLNSNEVLHILARYIGHDSTAESRKRLLRIAEHPASKSSRSQALVCLAHQGDPEYLEALFSFLLIDAGLAYSLRRGYGEVAIPYLLRALGESTSPSVRRAVAYELVHLEVREGFAHLSEVALADPAPQGKQSRPLDGIRQFARDYLDLPKDVLSSEAIAEHISKRMPVETDVEEGLSNK